MRFEAVTMKIAATQVVMPCSVVDYSCFGAQCSFQLHCFKMEAACSSKHISKDLSEYSTTSQKTVIFIIRKLKIGVLEMHSM
jgi:hypothetical protein